MIAVLKRSRQASRPRATPEYDKYIDNIWDEGFRKTLGALIVSLRNSGLRVPADLQGDLGRSLDQRNRLVHSFFRERAESWFQPDGRRAMAEELGQMREQFRKTDRALHEVTESLRKARGIPDSVVERYIELRKQGVGEDEAMDIALREAGQRAAKIARAGKTKRWRKEVAPSATASNG